MRKYLKKVIMISLAISLLCPVTSMATPKGRNLLDSSVQENSTLLPENIKMSMGKEQGIARSKALASAMCMITNKENGILSVYAETLMFQSVDWAALTIYLEQLNESTGKWSTVETFEKEFTPADREDGQLTSVEFSVSVGTQPAGHYYRLRCIHELEYDNGWYEAKSTKTEGVLLTNIK